MNKKKEHNIQQTDHFSFLGVAAGATQPPKKKNGGCCFSLVATAR